MKQSRFRVASSAALVLAIAMATLSTALPAHAAPTEEPRRMSPITVEDNPNGITDYEGVTVVHWGPGYSSGALDASIPSNRDLEKVRSSGMLQKSPKPTDGPTAGRSTQSLDQDVEEAGFKCTLFVGRAFREGSSLKALTEQTCTGAFSEKFVTVTFARRNAVAVWVNFSPASESEHTSDYIDDLTWATFCDGTGAWLYRMEAMPYARSSEDGALVGGGRVDGAQSAGNLACGTSDATRGE